MKRIALILLIIVATLFGCSNIPVEQTQTSDLVNSWSKEVVYFLLIDRFYNGDRTNDFNIDRHKILFYHGGDFKGLIDKFGYLKDLNVGTILFTPIMDNRNSDFFGHWGLHGYWIIDHYKIDEHLGDDMIFDRFTQLRLKNNKRFLLDIVLNHVDWDHPWIKQHPSWFHTLESITDWNDPVQLVEGRVTGLPDLNQDVPAVYDELMKYTHYWIDKSKADGLRLDAVKHIDHDFWKRYIREVNHYAKEKHGINDFLFLAEILHGDPYYYLPYLEDGFNGFYDYPLYFTVTDVFARHQSMFNLPSRLQTEDEIFKNIVLATFLDNHDMPRFLSLSDKVDVQDMYQALTFYMTVRGLPLIYSGTEAHMRGENGEAGRQTIDLNSVPGFDYLSKISKMRRDLPSLGQGLREDLLVTDTYYVYRKIIEGEESLIFMTRGKGPITLHLPLEENSLFTSRNEVIDHLKQRKAKVIKGVLQVSLQQKDLAIFTIQGKASRYFQLQQKKAVLNGVKFFLKVDHLAPDEHLYLVGNHRQVGKWDTGKAVGPLKRMGQNRYEIEVIIPQKTVVEYKFIKKKINGEVIWENNPNRFLFVEKDGQQARHQWGTL